MKALGCMACECLAPSICGTTLYLCSVQLEVVSRAGFLSGIWLQVLGLLTLQGCCVVWQSEKLCSLALLCEGMHLFAGWRGKPAYSCYGDSGRVLVIERLRGRCCWSFGRFTRSCFCEHEASLLLDQERVMCWLAVHIVRCIGCFS